MRLVTFQSRTVTDSLQHSGKVETLIRLGGNLPCNIRRSNDGFIFIQLDDKIMKFSEDMKEEFWTIHKSKRKDRILPFYAYSKHYFCGEPRNMSIGTIYRLASHFMGACGYDHRDIIELEVPDDIILLSRDVPNEYSECLLPYIENDWVVSVLKFKDYVTEPIHRELSLAYDNEVYKDNTYHMCYSNSVVLNGHGYGDKLECCQSPALLRKVPRTSIQRDYVQPGLWDLFCKFAYVLRHGMSCEDISDVKGKYAAVEMPEEFDIGLIPAFNAWVNKLCEQTGTVIYDTSLSYAERVKLIKESAVLDEETLEVM